MCICTCVCICVYIYMFICMYVIMPLLVKLHFNAYGHPVSHSPGGKWCNRTPIMVNVTRDPLAILNHWTDTQRLAQGACVTFTGRKVVVPHSHNCECDTGYSSNTYSLDGLRTVSARSLCHTHREESSTAALP